MKSPEFFDLKKFHYTVKRKVSLENGKEVLCYIPVFGDNFDFEENKVKTFNISNVFCLKRKKTSRK